jgi:8-amino-7-oxononanoate synthase
VSDETEFDRQIDAELTRIKELDLYRELRRIDSPQSRRIDCDGQTLTNFSSNDYLGLADHPALKEAAECAVKQYGAGSGAARLVCGSLRPHHELEEAIAEFKHCQAALAFASGYTAALGAIVALLDSDDLAIIDKRVHACIVDAVRLCGAKIRVFKHNDLANLEEILQWADRRTVSDTSSSFAIAARRQRRTLIITESVFSMDGDRAPLREIVQLKQKYGAWLMVDEAHATGVIGPDGRGLIEECGLSGRVEVQMGTLGKAIGAAGGFICGSRSLIDLLINRARTFMFSTAPVPAASAAATAGIRLIQSHEGAARRAALWERLAEWHASASDSPSPSAIVPLIVGSERIALHLASELRRSGFLAPAIRYPTVARNQARLRLAFSASHSKKDVVELKNALDSLGAGKR